MSATSKELAILLSGSDQASPALANMKKGLEGVGAAAKSPELSRMGAELDKLQQSLLPSKLKAMRDEMSRLGAEIAKGGDTKQLLKLNAELEKVSHSFRQVAASAKTMSDDVVQTGQKASNSFANLAGQGAKMAAGFVGFMGITAGLQKLGGSITDAIGNASNLNETINKSAVIFGSAQDAVLAFAQDSAQAMGQSKQQAIEAAATFGNLFKTMGMGQGDVRDMSLGMTKLASDLASFHNIPVDVALEKLRSGLVGEAEPMRTLGVLLDEETVKLKAVSMGLSDNAENLTQAQKVQARYAIIVAQTSDAQGDFARTSTGLANAQRIIQASFANISAEIGGRMLPKVAEVVSAFAVTLPRAFEDAKPWLDAVGSGLHLIGDGLGFIGSKSGDAAEGLGNVTRAAIAALPAESEYISLLNQHSAALREIYGASAFDFTMPAGRLGGKAITDDETLSIRELTDAYSEAADAQYAYKVAKDSATQAMLNGIARSIDERTDVGDTNRFYEEKAAKDEEDRKRKAESAAKSAATKPENLAESSARQTRELLKDIDADAGATVIKIANIGQRVGDEINRMTRETGKGIQDAYRQAIDALKAIDAQEAINADISRRRKEVDQQIWASDRAFRLQMGDEEFHHREAQDLAKIGANEAKALGKAKTEDEKKQIRENAADQREALRERHLDFDLEVQWQIQQEDKARAHQQAMEQVRADLERALHDDELGRQRDRITQERDAKIAGLNDAFIEKKRILKDEAKAEIAKEKLSAAGRLGQLKTEFLDKLAEAGAPGIASFAAMIEGKLGGALVEIAAMESRVNEAAGLARSIGSVSSTGGMAGVRAVRGPESSSSGDVIVNVGGSVVSEGELVDVIHDGLLRKQRRNGGLGW